jgi:hypothetical protein
MVTESSARDFRILQTMRQVTYGAKRSPDMGQKGGFAAGSGKARPSLLGTPGSRSRARRAGYRVGNTYSTTGTTRTGRRVRRRTRCTMLPSRLFPRSLYPPQPERRRLASNLTGQLRDNPSAQAKSRHRRFWTTKLRSPRTPEDSARSRRHADWLPPVPYYRSSDMSFPGLLRFNTR